MATSLSHSRPPLDLVPSSKEKRSYAGLALFIFFVALGFFTVALDGPPRPLSEQVPSTEFSAARAMKHLSVIAQAPHPVNSAQHNLVRDYILSTLRTTGLESQVQTSTGVFGIQGALENIVARMQGSTREKAILLVAHYDSVAVSPGASDDGAAVAALLETARALKSLPQLKRDIIFLFTDGEEKHLLGARAFVSGHPWAADIGIVLNFEARGVRGPSIMFETSDENGWLISNFGQAVSHPVANSLSYEIYKRMPNDTDFTVFRHAGYSGLNFAFIDGFAYYHTAFDSIQNIDPGSLQHHGDYLLELARALGNTTSDNVKAPNVVYFDVLGKVLVRYSQFTARVLLGLAIVLTATVLYIGIRNGRLRIGPCMLGLLAMIFGVAVTVLGAWGTSQLIFATQSHRIHAGLRYHPGLYVMAFCALGLACAMSLYAVLAKRINSIHLLVGSCLGWLGFTLAVSGFFPGGSYLFIWPLLFSLLGGLVAVVASDSPVQRILLVLSGVPAVLIIIPLAHKIFWAFAAGSGVIIGAMLGLVVSLLIAQLALEKMPHRWLLPALPAAAGVVLLVAALVR